MIAEAIDRILSLSGSKAEKIEGRLYRNGPEGIIALTPPKAETLTINTLTGVVDYAPDYSRLMIHVIDHANVSVIDAEYSDEWLKRSVHLLATHGSPVFKFGEFIDNEKFIIALQSMFVQDESTAAILKIVGNIKDGAVKTFGDNGITQSVTGTVGISMQETIPVPNPVVLRPYRTFMEVEQPASSFVFRMQSGRGDSPMCSLYESDGQQWKLKAIQSIKEWLRERIPAIKIIA